MGAGGRFARISSAAGRSRAAASGVGRAMRRGTEASGAGRTGLSKLIELSALNSAGDAAVAVALAGTVFFGMPVGQARSHVALYLLITIAPFAIVAPLVGPVLDRMRSARRIAMAGSMLARGLLCWGMAGAVQHNDAVTLLPAAFGVLVLSKAYGVTRSAVTPRLLPAEITLVTANARCALAGLIGGALGVGVLGGATKLLGADWALRLDTLVFLGCVVLALRLPRHLESPEAAAGEPAASDTDAAARADSAEPAGPESAGAGTEPADDSVAGEPGGPGVSGPPGGARRYSRTRRTLMQLGPLVSESIVANMAIRVFSGFMVLFCAFLLRTEDFGVSSNLALGMLAVGAGAGGFVGTSIGAWVRSRAPQLIVFGALTLAMLMAGFAAAAFMLATIIAAAFVAAFAQSLGKLALDAVVQREIGEEVRSSTFAVSETLHQLSWVVGGLVGLALSLTDDGTLSLGLIAALLAGALAVLLIRRTRRGRTRRAQMAPAAPAAHR